MMRKTKIICTIGPSTESKETLMALMQAGMNVARLNFSHGTHDEHLKKIINIKAAREELNLPVALLLDTKGPEIRVRDFENGYVYVEAGQEFTLTCRQDVVGNESIVSISYEELYNQVNIGEKVLIDDGNIQLTITDIRHKDIVCKVLNNGRISNKKGINLPGARLDMEYLGETDKKDILFGIENDVDYIAASFVRKKEDLIDLRKFLEENGGNEIKIISKIENQEGLDNFDEILSLSDGIMVARGDMGVEIDYEKLPGIQKNIIKKCGEAGKKVITATQMLESMIEKPAPTRAEITDVANAVYDGTSAVMLSGETTIGKYPIETVKAMSKIVLQAEMDAPVYDLYSKINPRASAEISDAIGHAAHQAAKDIDAAAIIAITLSGYTAEQMSKYTPSMPIIAATPSKKTFYQSVLLRGVIPILTHDVDDLDVLMKEAVEISKNKNLLKQGDMVAFTAGIPIQKRGTTNLLRIETV